MQGFAVNDAVVSSIGTTYALNKKILLHEDSSADSLSKALPQSCYLSHLDIQIVEGSGTAEKVSAFLAWDEDGDDPMSAESKDNVLWTGMTTASAGSAIKNTSIALDVFVTAPSGQTTKGKCYLWIKVSGSSPSVSLQKARLHWAIRPTK